MFLIMAKILHAYQSLTVNEMLSLTLDVPFAILTGYSSECQEHPLAKREMSQ